MARHGESPRGGTTFLEALFVFAILAVVAGSIFLATASGRKSDAQNQRVSQFLREANLAQTLLSLDLEARLPPPVGGQNPRIQALGSDPAGPQAMVLMRFAPDSDLNSPATPELVIWSTEVRDGRSILVRQDRRGTRSFLAMQCLRFLPRVQVQGGRSRVLVEVEVREDSEAAPDHLPSMLLLAQAESTPPTLSAGSRQPFPPLFPCPTLGSSPPPAQTPIPDGPMVTFP